MSREERGFSRQLAVAEDGVAKLVADLARTTSLRPEIVVDLWRDGVRIAYEGNWSGPVMVAVIDQQHAIAEVGDYLQAYVMEDLATVWPVCPAHAVGAHGEVRDDAAVWWCRVGAHSVATIGTLGE